LLKKKNVFFEAIRELFFCLFNYYYSLSNHSSLMNEKEHFK